MSELSDVWRSHLIGSVLEGAMIGRRGFDHYGFAGRGYGLILFSDAGIEFTLRTAECVSVSRDGKDKTDSGEAFSRQVWTLIGSRLAAIDEGLLPYEIRLKFDTDETLTIWSDGEPEDRLIQVTVKLDTNWFEMG
ncbi:hypothetical protein DLJ53_24730 [Acuticoccus sediminis]|uniref:Uncharacterized protein n=1 Tax=Acuticoccus sediminis TaxID=2184697 RepID=A0A8B2NTC4_9HYPH|nr:hypothetical protein [Acuticoccus sediminis]RAH98843.1 hypothetical protein DLJ53_24730 [Acuticoccus sediminis]